MRTLMLFAKLTYLSLNHSLTCFEDMPYIFFVLPLDGLAISETFPRLGPYPHIMSLDLFGWCLSCRLFGCEHEM